MRCRARRGRNGPARNRFKNGPISAAQHCRLAGSLGPPDDVSVKHLIPHFSGVPPDKRIVTAKRMATGILPEINFFVVARREGSDRQAVKL